METNSRHLVTEAVSKTFETDGVVLLGGVIDDRWLDRLRTAIERDMASPGAHFHGYRPPEGQGRFHGSMRLWEHDDDFRDYCWNSPLPALAAELMKTDKVNLFYDQLFVKEPETPTRTRWHNDQPYWPVRGWPVMSFWLALDPVTSRSGALEFIRGSHRWDRWFQPEAFAPGGAEYEKGPGYEPIPDFEAEREAHEIVCFDMQPGDVVAFHALMVHGAGGNDRDDVRRRGYAVRYCGRDATYYAGPGTNGDLCNPGLADGDPLDSDQYPVVWERNLR